MHHETSSASEKMPVLHVLGYLGLVPFLVLTILTFFPVIPGLDALQLFLRYSAIILGFMAGVLWPVWSQRLSVWPLALFAVSLPVLSFLAGLLPTALTLSVELILFWCCAWVSVGLNLMTNIILPICNCASNSPPWWWHVTPPWSLS